MYPALDGVVDFRAASMRSTGEGWTLEGFEKMYEEFGDWTSIFDWDEKRGIPRQVSAYKYQRIKGWILNTMRLGNGARVLDLGCGNGYFLMEISKRFQASNPSATYIGLDVSAHNIVNFTRRLRQAAIRHTSAILGTAESLPFESNSIDVVVSSEAMEHIEGRETAIKEVYRVLAPGGVFLFTTPSKQALRNWNIVLLPLIIARRLAQFRVRATPRKNVYDVPLATADYRDMLTRAGFRTVSLRSAQLLNNHVATRLPRFAVDPYVSVTGLLERSSILRKAFGLHIIGHVEK